MSRAAAHAIDLADGNDIEAAVDWAAVDAGPVIVHPRRVKRPDLPGSMFADDTWSLRPMGVTRGTIQNLHWIPGTKEQQYSVPPHLIEPFKRVVWLIINRPAPVAYLAGNNSRRWPAASSVCQRFRVFRHFAHFLGRHEITRLCDVSEDLLDTYATAVLADESRSSQAAKAQGLGYIAVIAHLADYLPEPIAWSNRRGLDRTSVDAVVHAALTTARRSFTRTHSRRCCGGLNRYSNAPRTSSPP